MIKKRILLMIIAILVIITMFYLSIICLNVGKEENNLKNTIKTETNQGLKQSELKYENIKSQSIVLNVRDNMIYTSPIGYVAEEGGYELEEYDYLTVKTSNDTNFLDFYTLDFIEKSNIKENDIIFVEGNARRIDRNTIENSYTNMKYYEFDASNKIVKVLQEKDFTELKENILRKEKNRKCNCF